MRWIYLSPHFDDAALSCGGLAWEQAHAGSQVSVWTVCAGEPPAGEISPFAQSLHARWEVEKNAPARRRDEDLASCRRLGAGQYTFSIPDCIYRRDPRAGEFLYPSEEALTGSLHPADYKLIEELRDEMKGLLDAGDILVSPLGLGNHVDHQLTRTIAEGLGSSLWYYADYPYVLGHSEQLEQLESAGWKSQVCPVSPAGLSAWTDSIADHASQISTFWPGKDQMALAIADYLQTEGGIRLWQRS